MAKRFPAHLVKTHRIYTVWEAADTLGSHRQSVLRWIKSKKLKADQSSRPWLILGADLKAFLGQRSPRGKRKLPLHHIKCFGCKTPQEPDGKIADYTPQTHLTGRLTGLCPSCGAVMCKIISRSNLPAIEAKLEVTLQRASPRLVVCDEPRSIVDSDQEGKTCAKRA